MKNPIFVFSDDLDIFKNSEAAERYMEPWLLKTKVSVFDSTGRVLNCLVEKKPSTFLWGVFGTVEAVKIKDSQQVSPKDFREQLVSYLKRLEKHNGRKGPLDLTHDNSLELLVQAALDMKGYTS